MSPKLCSRRWQAEAVLDGVLSRADTASFERHAATCSECSQERAALTRLASVARRLPSAEVRPLRRRALRHQLLRRANELSTGEAAPRSGLGRVRIWLPIAACVLGLLVLVLWRFPRAASVAGSQVAPKFELASAPNSRWHVAQRGSSLRLALDAGSFVIAVHKLEKAQRFSLQLPDGELEVRGTRFRVECDAHKTRSVAVEEGRVVLRLTGRAELSLGPGQAWPPQTAQLPLESPLPSSSSESVLSRPPAAKTVIPAPAPSRRALAARSQPHPLPSGVAPSSSAASPAPGPASTTSDGAFARPAAARDFAQAMTAFSHGDFGTAERLFRAFEQQYPDNAHVEDVLFLRALGRSRRGDASGARVLAREYLRRYPAGFRAVEAHEMAREPAPRAGLGASPGLVDFH